MAERPTAWKPGQSGNPNGRPKKKRALTQALESASSRIVTLADGTRVNGKRYLAGLALQAVESGRITLASGKVIELSPEDMMFFWKFIYQQVDGPPPQDVRHSGDEDGAPVSIVISYANDVDETPAE